MGTQLTKGGQKAVDPEMLKNLDMLEDYEVLKQESAWDVLADLPDSAFDEKSGLENEVKGQNTTGQGKTNPGTAQNKIQSKTQNKSQSGQ